MRHILLATTGESPQVVTETLYAVAQNNDDWPEQIYLITTTLGETRARTGLLEQGHLKRLCDEIGKPIPQFTADDILVVPNAQGQPVDDARSLEDHEALANFIMTQVRDLTADDTITIHASLAGGRKTMTFYLGYAMSLFGRIQDRLSHVLISQGYENRHDFWYPSAEQSVLLDREGKALTHPDGSPLMPRDAKVTLAPIPFIRQRATLPLLTNKAGAVNFRDLVRAINLAEQPEDILLTLDFAKSSIILEDSQGEMNPIIFQPGLLELAFFQIIAQATSQGNTQLTRPKEGTPSLELATHFIRNLLHLCGLPEKESAIFGLESLEDWIELHGQINPRTIEKLKGGDTGIVGMSDSFFSQRTNDIKALLQTRLPAQLEARLTPKPLYDKKGNRQDNAKSGGYKGGGYAIDIPAENIRILL
jgi:CRISPR-associated protein (TIGR02584 family)